MNTAIETRISSAHFKKHGHQWIIHLHRTMRGGSLKNEQSVGEPLVIVVSHVKGLPFGCRRADFFFLDDEKQFNVSYPLLFIFKRTVEIPEVDACRIMNIMRSSMSSKCRHMERVLRDMKQQFGGM
ncbi:MAG: hypothetical protein LBE22_10550 [Azoarcus sp.]|jgi:hypothetical protein|nr:hypothetical protein [Azoarcus sp.]